MKPNWFNFPKGVYAPELPFFFFDNEAQELVYELGQREDIRRLWENATPPADSGVLEFIDLSHGEPVSLIYIWRPGQGGATAIMALLAARGKRAYLHTFQVGLGPVEEGGVRFIMDPAEEVEAFLAHSGVEKLGEPGRDQEGGAFALRMVSAAWLSLSMKETTQETHSQNLKPKRHGVSSTQKVVYRKVKIHLGEAAEPPGDEGEGGVGGPRRKHFVRGFLRLTPSKGLVPVRPHWRGSLAVGLSHHHYEVTT